MKKLISLFLAALLLLPLIACSAKTPDAPAASVTDAPAEANASEPTEEPTPEPIEEPTPEPTEELTPEPPKEVVYEIGETANGELFNVRLDSFRFLRKIHYGKAIKVYSGNNVHYDPITVVPVDGYTIAEITLTVTYNGKQGNKLDLEKALLLDYDDGYTFRPIESNSNMPTTSDSTVGYYLFNDRESDFLIDVSNPLSFKGEEKTIYIFANDVVKTEKDKTLLLKLTLPTETGTEEVVFNARVTESEEEQKEALYQEAVADMKTGDYYYAIPCLEELGDYKDSKELLREATLKYNMMRGNKDVVLEELSSFTVMNGSEISGMIVGTWRISQGSNHGTSLPTAGSTTAGATTADGK